jgi:uncharacterized membrane protein
MLLSWYPALPPWDGMHPLMVQFPLALLLAAPLLVLVSLVARQTWRPWAVAGLMVMALGTLAIWFAAGTGHAAGQLVEKSPALQQAISRHEAIAMAARGLFTGLTLLYAAIVLVPLWRRWRLPDSFTMTVHVLFLALYVACTGVLAQAANAGGHLVHEYGVRAMVQLPDSGTVSMIAELPAVKR